MLFRRHPLRPSLSANRRVRSSATYIRINFDGYRWLSFMNRGGLGCIIGDEMGLGKTLQVICLILEAVEKNHCPNLVVAPGNTA